MNKLTALWVAKRMADVAVGVLRDAPDACESVDIERCRLDAGCPVCRALKNFTAAQTSMDVACGPRKATLEMRGATTVRKA